MGNDFDFHALRGLELRLSGPREGDETEVIEKGGGSGETKRGFTALFALGPREGDETEVTERDGGGESKLKPVATQGDPREGDETTPIRESPLGPPVRV